MICSGGNRVVTVSVGADQPNGHRHRPRRSAAVRQSSCIITLCRGTLTRRYKCTRYSVRILLPPRRRRFRAVAEIRQRSRAPRTSGKAPGSPARRGQSRRREVRYVSHDGKFTVASPDAIAIVRLLAVRRILVSPLRPPPPAPFFFSSLLPPLPAASLRVPEIAHRISGPPRIASVSSGGGTAAPVAHDQLRPRLSSRAPRTSSSSLHRATAPPSPRLDVVRLAWPR